MGWGPHGDFPKVAGLGWLLERRAGFEQWRESVHGSVGPKPPQKQEDARSLFPAGCRLPRCGGDGGWGGGVNHGEGMPSASRPGCRWDLAVSLKGEWFCSPLPGPCHVNSWQHLATFLVIPTCWEEMLQTPRAQQPGMHLNILPCTDRASPSKELSGPK